MADELDSAGIRAAGTVEQGRVEHTRVTGRFEVELLPPAMSMLLLDSESNVMEVKPSGLAAAPPGLSVLSSSSLWNV